MVRVSDSVTAATMLKRALLHHAGDDDPIDWPLRTLLYARDELRFALSQQTGERLHDWEPTPPSTEAPEWDALLAAIVEHEFQQAGVRPPDWTHHDPIRPEWVPPHPILSEQQVRDETPEWLKAVGIFMASRDLDTA